jgi:RNA polymerase-binding transcription factor DksA
MPGTLVPVPDHAHPDLAGSLPYLRGVLDDQRRFRIEQLATLAAAVPVPADGARDQINAALTVAACRALVDIERALGRIDAGTYGTCQHCGGPIVLERLYAIPQAALCGDCQRADEPDR